MRMRLQALAGIIVAAGLAFGPAVCRGEDWPQLQHDAQRTGHTQDPGPANGKVLWEFDLNRELVGKCTQPVIAGGKVYLGSLRGVLRCFDAATGTVAWEYKTKGPIAHSAGVADGRVLCADLAGNVYALDAAKGTEVFVFKAGLPGFSSAVALAEGKVFIGRRDGVFFCIDGQTGKEAWRFDAAAPIFMTAACADGRVFFGGEDMVLHALGARTGRAIWKTDKLHGLGFLWYWPVVHKGRVIVNTLQQPTAQDVFKMIEPQGHAAWLELLKSLKDGRDIEKHRHARVPYDKENLDHDQGQIARWMERHPEYQSFYVLDVQTGKQAYAAPIIPAATNTNLMFPPVVLANGRLETYFAGCHLFHDSCDEFRGEFDVALGRVVVRTGYCIDDQTRALSSGAGKVFDCGDALNTPVGQAGPLEKVRTVRTFTQSGQSSMAIVGKRLYYTESDVLYCFGE
jgi:hypothetical protein